MRSIIEIAQSADGSVLVGLLDGDGFHGDVYGLSFKTHVPVDPDHLTWLHGYPNILALDGFRGEQQVIDITRCALAFAFRCEARAGVTIGTAGFIGAGVEHFPTLEGHHRIAICE